jgi:glycosyltransferase involved in cell wall biosynthesis
MAVNRKRSLKEQVIVYALGEYWKTNAEKISEKYDIIACSDRNPEAAGLAGEYPFVLPEKMTDMSYDWIILACKRRGVREDIVLKYHVPIQKVLYFDEITGYTERNAAPGSKKYSFSLTVVIPTYNRKERLNRTLDILELQTCDNFKVIILDNDSDYDVNDVIVGRDTKFRERIKLVHNKRNIGMHGNLASAFVQETEGWLWTLSDDDIPSLYAVEDICEEIERNRETGAILFSILDLHSQVQEGRIFQNLRELLSFYKSMMEANPKTYYDGDFIYFSNKVYNLEYIKNYCDKVFLYTYTGVPQLVPILFMLYEETASVCISNKKIIQYDSPDGNHWNWAETVLGMRIISDFPFDLDVTSQKTLYRLIVPSYQILLKEVARKRTKNDTKFLDMTYQDIYRYLLSEEEKKDFKQKLDDLRE